MSLRGGSWCEIEERADFSIRINASGQGSPENVNLPEMYINLFGVGVRFPHVIELAKIWVFFSPFEINIQILQLTGL